MEISKSDHELFDTVEDSLDKYDSEGGKIHSC